MTRELLRIANCSGFYGDRPNAAHEVVSGGPIDVLTGDYLAELTMLILWKDRQRNPEGGFAKTFLDHLESVLAECVQRGVRVVVNAGGLNPAGLAAAVRTLANRVGVQCRVAHIEGDDLLGEIPRLREAGVDLRRLGSNESFSEAGVEPVTANTYLGAWGIVRALESGADIVITPRVTDASLVVGPCAWAFGWAHDDWDKLASAVTVGHIIECGAQATGGNYSFFDEIDASRLPGMPIAEVSPDGSAVITKHPGTGGLVSVGTVTAQLLYEIGGARYLNADVTARFDTITLTQQASDRVAVAPTRGEPAPTDLKVCVNYNGGYRNTVTFMLTGVSIAAKAAWIERAFFEAVGGRGQFEEVGVRLIGARADGDTNADATGQLRITAKSKDKALVGRRFSNTAASLSLSTFPGFYSANPPQDAQAFGVYWPALVPANVVTQTVVNDAGERLAVDDLPVQLRRFSAGTVTEAATPPKPTGLSKHAQLGDAFGARSGDKGGDANVGVWARSPLGYSWLYHELTIDRLKELCPELVSYRITRHCFTNLNAVNFVIEGLLGDGVASAMRPDPQAKSLSEFLRSRWADLPAELLA